MKRLILVAGLSFSQLTLANDVENLFKQSMSYYRNATFCMFYDKSNMDDDSYMASYYSISRSVQELEESMSWSKWGAKKVLDHIIIQEVVEQSSESEVAQLKNRCANISKHAIHLSAKSLREDIDKLRASGEM
ncbi:hypothetical protein C4G29_RS22660 [Vibrio parahaemolyticus]|jgi:hypothetical protein|uniref:hypothetical protein n=1 Tax=Vibrio harveyi group TaxID=717610 RepID=UPI0006B2A256|nr:MULTISPECIES: hypothetical protein [Vibrio harveyi group]EHR1165422.1 hypothetical protein [Vibrio parahaemolyticus]EHZ2783897.1 hypothetical protein [Vibrio parahaemolyticus]EIJ2834963.1 hypothetical protein [Vibrio parahaemolyticus]EJG0664866.1 hypothetical protein [Vibrio parahaemolyticus]EJG1834084.1 hypothetical protein [Vibrio parahaemolyticus]